MSFEIKLPLFQGPFDLLLFFIERDELDIYDIPIAKITDDFLDYLHHLEKFNLEVASDFILMAATLMRIKVRMLLPRKELDEQGKEIDPREELIRHLLEYKKFKSVTDVLSQMEDERLSKEKRGNIERELQLIAQAWQGEEPLEKVDLYKLLKTFQRITERYEIRLKKPSHTIVQYPYTIEDKKQFILDQVADGKRLSFEDLLRHELSRVAAIFNFLAILELVQLEQIKLEIGEGYNHFWISKQEAVTVS